MRLSSARQSRQSLKVLYLGKSQTSFGNVSMMDLSEGQIMRVLLKPELASEL